MDSPRNSLTLLGLQRLLAVIVGVAILFSLWAMLSPRLIDPSVTVTVPPSEVGLEVGAASMWTIRDVVAEVPASSRAVRMITLGRVVQGFAVAAMAYALYRVVRSAREGELVSDANLASLRFAAMIAIVVFLGGFLVSIGRRTAAEDAGLDGPISINFWWLFVCILLFVPCALWQVAIMRRREVELMS